MSATVRMGTTNSQGVMWNFCARTVVYRSIWEASVPEWDRPRIVKMTSVMTMDGTVVKSM